MRCGRDVRILNSSIHIHKRYVYLQFLLTLIYLSVYCMYISIYICIEAKGFQGISKECVCLRVLCADKEREKKRVSVRGRKGGRGSHHR